VATQILLQVQNRQVVSLAQREQLAQRRIGLDGLLLHQVVGLSVGHDTLGDRRAADLSSLGVAQERAQLVRDLDRLGEDAGLGLRTLDLGAGPLTAAIGALGQAGGLLLDGLESRCSRRGCGLQVIQVLLQRRDGLLEGGTEILLGSRGRRGDLHNGRGGNHRGCDLSLDDLLSGLGHNGGGHNGGGYGGSLGLRGLLGGLRGGAHRVSGGGSRCGHGTQLC
jgi:hypothetical protein